MNVRAYMIAAGLVILQGVLLFALGQPALCECGYVKLWENTVLSSGNSQHIADWYTPSHVIHGLLFYLAVTYFFPKMHIVSRLAIAIGVEAAWEVFENTPMVIEHYRQQALAQGYVGDSIINSIFDTLAMVGGFLFAYRAPVAFSVVLLFGLELFVGYMIRDNLTLNILGFFYQPEFIGEWQRGGP